MVTVVFLMSQPAGAWQTNWYLVGASADDGCVIIDPGMDAAGAVRQAVRSSGRRVGGVLLTHGHIDHIADAASLAEEYGVPTWIHADDRPMLTDAGFLSADQLRFQFGITLSEPADLRLLTGGETLDLAGLSFTVKHAPGHTPGSVLYESEGTVFAGDVLFAGSIGRTDLPRGDNDAMLRTLREVVLSLADATVVHPGHGPSTDMARERARNPYLSDRYLRIP